MDKLPDESLSLTSLSLFKWVRPDLHWLILGILGSVLGGIIVIRCYSPDPVQTTVCREPDIRINFPVEGQPVPEIVELVGRFDCIPEARGLWITVTPPLGTPHGIHPVVVKTQNQTFTSTAVLSSGPGEYRICAALTDKDAEQAFQAAIKQIPPVGLAELPPSALLKSCTKVLVR